MNWLMTQAQQASPFIAVFCLSALGVVTSVLWRTHVKDTKTILEMSRSYGEAMNATSLAMERLTSAVVNNGRGRR